MMTNDILQLAPNERLPDRPFTHPENTEADYADLERIRALLCEVLQHAVPNQVPYEISSSHQRLIILNREVLLSVQPITVVGFCAHRRSNLSQALLDEMSVVDGDLVQELAQHSDMLTYSSIQLQDGNWKNLVLLRSDAGVGHWRDSQRHHYAANMLTPVYYAQVRLHNGVLPQGLSSPNIVLTSTKYYDFDSAPTWRAVRLSTPDPWEGSRF